jgi:hypothetical protein
VLLLQVMGRFILGLHPKTLLLYLYSQIFTYEPAIRIHSIFEAYQCLLKDGDDGVSPLWAETSPPRLDMPHETQEASDEMQTSFGSTHDPGEHTRGYWFRADN